MNDKNFTTSFVLDQSPAEFFEAITNVRGWWSQEIEGDTDRLGAVFYYHYQDIHRATCKITELVRGKKVVWHVLQNYFNFTKDQTEWTNTDIVFEITKKGNHTKLTFTHVGLTPTHECYPACKDGWTTYMDSLKNLIASGKGQPNVGEAITDSEKALSE